MSRIKKNNLRFLIIGLGSMGKRRIRNLLKLGYKDIIGYDKRRDRLTEVQKLYGIKTVGELEDAFLKNPNMIIISTPPNLHVEYVKLAITHKINFFSELNLLFNDVHQIMQLSKKYKIQGFPSFTMINHPMVKKIKQIIKSNTLGKILIVNHHTGHYLPTWHPWENLNDFFVSKKETGGAKELMAADLVWILDVFPKIKKVTGVVKKISDLKIESDDVYHAFLELSNGTICNLLIDVVTIPSVKITEIIGENGSITSNFVTGEIIIKKKNTVKKIMVKMGNAAKGYTGITPPEKLYEDEMKSFIMAVTKNMHYPYSFKDELEMLSVIKNIESNSNLMKKYHKFK